jgi:hypothetical protein
MKESQCRHVEAQRIRRDIAYEAAWHNHPHYPLGGVLKLITHK